MTYNTILVQFDHQGAADALLAFAADLSRRFDSDLIGFCAAEVRPLIPAAEGVSIDGEVMGSLVEDMEGDFTRLEHLFEEKMNDGDRATWRAFLDNPTRSLLLNARAADLIVTGKAEGSVADAEDQEDRKAPHALRDGRVAFLPILVVVFFRHGLPLVRPLARLGSPPGWARSSIHSALR